MTSFGRLCETDFKARAAMKNALDEIEACFRSIAVQSVRIRGQICFDRRSGAPLGISLGVQSAGQV